MDMVTNELPTLGGVLTNCPVCGSGNFEPVHLNSHARLISRCLTCKHHFVVNPLSDAEIAEIYDGLGYFSQNCNHQGIQSISQDDAWKEWVASRIATLDACCLSKLRPGPLAILEQGCLEGRVLNALAKLGHQVVGCDVNARVARLGRSCFGIDIREGTIESCAFDSESFDLIYSFHTLEHLRDPVRNLAATKALLKPGGMVFFEIPLNETDYENRDHLHFFSFESVNRVMQALFRDFSYRKNAFTTGGGQTIESILVWAAKR